MSATELSDLRNALQRLREVAAKGSSQEVMQAMWEFRRLLYGSSGNDALTKVIEQASDYDQVQFIILLALSSAAVRKLMLARLTQIFAAVESRDGDAVERAVHKNLDAWYQSTADALSRFEPSSG